MSQPFTDAVTVLVVDDDPIAIAVVEGHLVHVGIDVRSATSVAGALALLAEGPLPDVIISDVMMPGDDGFVLCDAVRDDEGLAHLPFLFVTAAGDREARIRALDAGADDLLAKPVDDVELVARVRSLARLSRSRYALRQRERTDAALGRIGDGVITLDLAGVVVDANPAAVRLLQLPRETAGLSLREHILANGFAVQQGDDPAVPFAAGRRSCLLHRPPVADGGDLYAKVIEEPVVDASGRVDARVLVVRDVTDEQRATRASDLIVSSIAHKFRTPLTGLRGAMEMFPMTEPSEVQGKLLEVMGNSLERLDVSLMRVLEFANAAVSDEAAATVQLTPEGVREALTSMLDGRHGGILDRAEVHLRGALELPLGPLSLVLDEYLDNATKAAGGAEGVSVRLVGGASDLTVIVEDTGPGFPPEDADRMFDRFFQADRTGQSDGMGLGLPLVRHVVETIGGQVSARWQPGEPTRFTARIPCVAPAT